MLESNACSRKLSSASYLPVCSDEYGPGPAVGDRTEVVDGLHPVGVVQVLADLRRDVVEHRDHLTGVVDRLVDLERLAARSLDHVVGAPAPSCRSASGRSPCSTPSSGPSRTPSRSGRPRSASPRTGSASRRPAPPRVRPSARRCCRRRARPWASRTGSWSRTASRTTSSPDRKIPFDVLALPALDEAVELRLRGGGVGARDREHRRRAERHAWPSSARARSCRSPSTPAACRPAPRPSCPSACPASSGGRRGPPPTARCVAPG